MALNSHIRFEHPNAVKLTVSIWARSAQTGLLCPLGSGSWRGNLTPKAEPPRINPGATPSHAGG